MNTLHAASIVFCATSACASSTTPRPDDPPEPGSPSGSVRDEEDGGPDAGPLAAPGRASTITVAVGSSTFSATLADSDTGNAFRSLLPLTLEMPDLNENEKHVSLPTSLPTAAAAPGTLRVGDLMLYGSSTLVLFYETFRSSYAYTRIGTIDDPSGLADALGRGTVTVRFERR